jgi:glycosyltransferase involved in cell wall biosynthesis
VLLDMARWLEPRQPASKLVLCGIGSPDDEAWIRGRGAIPLANLPPARMPLFYDALDLYVCASTWEGFNLPIVEAAWHGVPAVAYDAGAHREHVTAVLVPAGQADKLFSEAKRLAGDATLRASLSVQAWQRAQQFSWDECARQFEQLLRQVAA